MADIIDLDRMRCRIPVHPPARAMATALEFFAEEIRAAGHDLAADLVTMAAADLYDSSHSERGEGRAISEFPSSSLE